MTFPVSKRMLRVQSPMIPIVGEMARRRPGTISLGQGVVHYPPPESISAAAARAAQDPRAHRYSLAFGIDELLEAVRNQVVVASHIKPHHGPLAVIQNQRGNVVRQFVFMHFGVRRSR